MAEALLRAVGISKNFKGLAAVSAVDLELVRGEIHAVIGPNGAGKTTLLATIAGDLSPSSGEVFVADREITDMTVEARTRLGIGRTYQRSAIIPGISTLDTVRIAAMRHVRPLWRLLLPVSYLTDVTARAHDALARVNLSDRADDTSDILSHGDRRRLEIAAVLALEPTILLLDEPLAGLGPDESRDIVALFEELRRSCAVMLIEHDIDVVFSVANRITVLDNGRVIASGEPAEVRKSVAVQQAYLGSEDRPS
jgi:branched-chain amino acid transport system ATP-binding protein